MYDIIHNNKEILAKCEELHITPLIIGEEIELVNKQVKTGQALITISTSSNREILESNIDAITNIEENNKEDFLHHRRSGLDQIQLNTLKQRNNAYIANLHSIRESKEPEKMLGRIQQNIRLAKKKNVPIILASFANKPEELPSTHDQEATWRALGIPIDVVKNNQEEIRKLLERGKRRASKEYVAEGIHKT
ncbi:MAG: hypothetical protein ACMXYD_04680 [Candidatus Woesearchaeota archaeon]